MQTVEASRRNSSRLRTFVSSPDCVFSAVSYAIIAAMCLHWMHPGSVIETGDNYWQYRPFHAMLRSFAGWNHLINVAGARTVGPYAFPWLVPAAVFTAIGGDSFAQVAMLALMRMAAWTGAYALCRALGAGRTASFVAGWTLILNPYVHTMTIAAPDFDWLIACIVWMARTAVVAGREAVKRRGAQFSLTAISGLGLTFVSQNPGLIVVAAIAVLVSFGLGLLVAKDRAVFARWSAITAGTMLVASLWWIIPAANYYLGSTVSADTNVADYGWVVGNSSLLNNLRFIPTWAWSFATYFPYAKAFDGNAAVYASTFSIALLVALGLATARGRKAAIARYCSLAGLAMLFVSKGTHAPFAAINAVLYHLPGFAVFREPTSKTPLLALVLFVPVVGYAIDAVALRLNLALRTPRAGTMIVVASVALVASAVSAYPLLTGEAFHDATPGLPSVYASLPTYWKDAAAFLNARPDDGAVMVLPTDTFYQTDYTWGYYGYDGLAFFLFDRPVEQEIRGAYTEVPGVDAIAERIARAIDERSDRARLMLADFHIRYLLYRNDARMVNGVPILAEQTVLALPGAILHRFGPLDVIDLGDPGPAVTETSTWVATDGVSEADSVLELRSLFERLPRIEAAGHPATQMPIAAVIERAGVHATSASNASPFTNVPLRFVASDATSAKRIVAPLRSGYVVKTSFLRATDERNVAHLTAAGVTRAYGGPAIPLLYPSPSYELGLIPVFNPSTAPTRFDLDIALHAEPDDSYTLSSGGRTWRSASFAASDDPVLVRFSDVEAAPGQNDFTIASASRGPVGFGETHFERLAAVADYRGAHLGGKVVLSLKRPHAIVGSIPLGILANARPALALETAPDASAPAFGAISELSYNGRAYRCYAPLYPESQPDAIMQAIASCLKDDVLYRQVTGDDLARTIVRSIDIDAALPSGLDALQSSPRIVSIEASWDGPRSIQAAPARVELRRNGPNVDVISADPRLSLLAIGAPARSSTAPLAENVTFASDGFAIVKRPAGMAAPAILATREGYDPQWQGICVGHCPPFLQHFRVDGYRNGWLVSGTGTIFLFETIVVAQAALIIVALTLLGVLARRWRVDAR